MRYDKYRYFLSLITIIVSFALSFDCSFSNIFILLSNKRETCYKNRVLSETRKKKNVTRGEEGFGFFVRSYGYFNRIPSFVVIISIDRW